MKGLFYKKLIFALSFFLLALALSICFSVREPFASEPQPGERLFSLDANSEPVSTVLENISKASGYKIVIKTRLEDVPISIQLSNVTIDEAIRRIFQNYNHVEVWDDAEKKLELYIWDTKGAPVSVSGKNSKFIPSTKTFQ